MSSLPNGTVDARWIVESCFRVAALIVGKSSSSSSTAAAHADRIGHAEAHMVAFVQSHGHVDFLTTGKFVAAAFNVSGYQPGSAKLCKASPSYVGNFSVWAPGI